MLPGRWPSGARVKSVGTHCRVRFASHNRALNGAECVRPSADKSKDAITRVHHGALPDAYLNTLLRIATHPCARHIPRPNSAYLPIHNTLTINPRPALSTSLHIPRPTPPIGHNQRQSSLSGSCLPPTAFHQQPSTITSYPNLASLPCEARRSKGLATL